MCGPFPVNLPLKPKFPPDDFGVLPVNPVVVREHHGEHKQPTDYHVKDKCSCHGVELAELAWGEADHSVPRKNAEQYRRSARDNHCGAHQGGCGAPEKSSDASTENDHPPGSDVPDVALPVHVHVVEDREKNCVQEARHFEPRYS